MRKMGPLTKDHPLVAGQRGPCNGCGANFGDTCPACLNGFEEGEYVTLIEIGPGENSEARAAAREGRAYNAIAVAAHWACVTGEE